MLSRVEVKCIVRVPSRETRAAIAMLAAMTSVAHEFDDLPASRTGGPVRHVLEIGDQRLLVWFDDGKLVAVVTPFDWWCADTWDDADEEQAPIPVISFR